MNHFFLIMMVVAMVAVVVSLVLGLAVMVKGGEIDKKYSNKLMQARIQPAYDANGEAVACRLKVPFRFELQ